MVALSHLVTTSATLPNLIRDSRLIDTEVLTKGYIVSSSGLSSNDDMKGIPKPKFIKQTDTELLGATVSTSFRITADGFKFVKFTASQKLTPIWSPNRNWDPSNVLFNPS